MGAWGAGSFDNDDAHDWLGDLEEAEDAELLRETLGTVADLADDDYAEGPECSAAIAAAEVVAAGRGNPARKLPDEVGRWLRSHPLDDADRDLAVRAVARVRRASELKELWDEGDAAAWHAIIADLDSRLRRS
jgi:hypothetical protein